jgi:hypothetical protein
VRQAQSEICNCTRAIPSDLFGLQRLLDRIGMPSVQSAICNLKSAIALGSGLIAARIAPREQLRRVVVGPAFLPLLGVESVSFGAFALAHQAQRRKVGGEIRGHDLEDMLGVVRCTPMHK